MPPPESPVLELRSVDKTFAGGVEALRGFDLSVAAGELVCLVGPSGCGKSTVLRLVAGLAKPTGGGVTWSGGERPGFGFVFQAPTLMPWRRVWENVYLPLQLRGASKPDAKSAVDDALRLVGLEEFSRTYPHELSGGMKMRVSIARALVTGPSALLMDEPFAALDELTRSRLCNDLLRLWRASRWTTLFVTHNVYEAVYLADRVVVLSGRPGRVVGEVRVDASRPRDESWRRDPRYAELCGEVSALLMSGETLEAAS